MPGAVARRLFRPLAPLRSESGRPRFCGGEPGHAQCPPRVRLGGGQSRPQLLRDIAGPEYPFWLQINASAAPCWQQDYCLDVTFASDHDRLAQVEMPVGRRAAAGGMTNRGFDLPASPFSCCGAANCKPRSRIRGTRYSTARAAPGARGSPGATYRKGNSVRLRLRPAGPFPGFRKSLKSLVPFMGIDRAAAGTMIALT
jgi:hypothetical protein